jgi:hypothetical protein
MTPRQLRRAAERQQRKAERKGASPLTSQPIPTAPPLQGLTQNLNLKGVTHDPMPAETSNRTTPISEAHQAASRENGSHSRGPKTAETRATSSQNHTTHGLARHINGTFQLLTSEDPDAFETFKQSLIAEHLPTTETECLLVNNMAECHWLAQRAQRLQGTCLDPATGVVTDDKKFSLYIRYQTTHTRAFHKSLTELHKLRSERRKAALGFEAQEDKHLEDVSKKLRAEAEKEGLAWDNFRKEAQARYQVAINVSQFLHAKSQFTDFDAEYTAALAEVGLSKVQKECKAQAA